MTNKQVPDTRGRLSLRSSGPCKLLIQKAMISHLANAPKEIPMRKNQPPPNLILWRRLGAAGLGLVALVVLVFTAPFIVQAFRGPRTITEQELLAIKEPGWWDYYVRYKPPRPAAETGVRYGIKDNAGTKYVLLPAGNRALFASVRIANNGPEYVGRLGSFGQTEEEAVRMGQAKNLLPFMLQGVRSIWFDTAVAVVLFVGCVGGAVWLLLVVPRVRTGKKNQPRSAFEEFPDDR